MNVLCVRNNAQKIMFESEFAGQISDGMWENLGVRDHWIPWTSASVFVNPDNVGRNFWAPYDAYNFTSRELLEIVGDRVLEKVQETIPDYTRERMMTDLRDLKKIKKLRLDESRFEVITMQRPTTQPLTAPPAFIDWTEVVKLT